MKPEHKEDRPRAETQDDQGSGGSDHDSEQEDEGSAGASRDPAKSGRSGNNTVVPAPSRLVAGDLVNTLGKIPVDPFWDAAGSPPDGTFPISSRSSSRTVLPVRNAPIGRRTTSKGYEPRAPRRPLEQARCREIFSGDESRWADFRAIFRLWLGTYSGIYYDNIIFLDYPLAKIKQAVMFKNPSLQEDALDAILKKTPRT